MKSTYWMIGLVIGTTATVALAHPEGQHRGQSDAQAAWLEKADRDGDGLQKKRKRLSRSVTGCTNVR